MCDSDETATVLPEECCPSCLPSPGTCIAFGDPIIALLMVEWSITMANADICLPPTALKEISGNFLVLTQLWPVNRVHTVI